MTELSIADRIRLAKIAKIQKHNAPILEAVESDPWATPIADAVGAYYALRPVVLPPVEDGAPLVVTVASLRPHSLNEVRVDIPGESRSKIYSTEDPALIVGCTFDTFDDSPLARLAREGNPAVDSTRCDEHGYAWARSVGGKYKLDCQKCATESGNSSRRKAPKAAPVTVTKVSSPRLAELLAQREEVVALGEDGAELLPEIDAAIAEERTRLAAA